MGSLSTVLVGRKGGIQPQGGPAESRCPAHVSSLCLLPGAPVHMGSQRHRQHGDAEGNVGTWLVSERERDGSSGPTEVEPGMLSLLRDGSAPSVSRKRQDALQPPGQLVSPRG